MDLLDHRLTVAGDAWRRSRRPSPDLDEMVAGLDLRAPRRPWALPAAVAAMFAVLVLAVTLGPRLPGIGFVPGGSDDSSRIWLLTADGPSLACRDALGGGRLVADARSGLAVVDEEGEVTVVRWPFGYTARQEVGRIALVDPTGRTVARDGDTIRFAGGEVAGTWHVCPWDSVVVIEPWSSPAPPTPTVAPSPVAVPLRTFAWDPDIGCEPAGAGPAVQGHLAGSVTAQSGEHVWLVATDGTRLFVRWPEGFTARFAPGLEILSETGALVASEGDSVQAQVPRVDFEGSVEHPFDLTGILIAGSFTEGDLSSGIAFNGCYPAIVAVRPVAWWVDPGSLPLPAGSRSIRALVNKRDCASGMSPEYRINAPTIEYRADAVVVTFTARDFPGGGGEECRGGELGFPVTIELAEPLGVRTLLDGSTSPPRSALDQP
jgi:hypothetical protein